MNIALIVLAAGRENRGGGLKQFGVEGLGGTTIFDWTGAALALFPRFTGYPQLEVMTK